MEYTEKRKRKREEIPHRSFWAVLGVGTLFLWRSLIYKPARWIWRHGLRLTRWTLRSCWRVTVWALQKTWAATKWIVLAPFRLLRWLYNMFIRGIPEPEDPFLAIRWRIKRRFRRRQRFMTHLFAFLGVNFIAAADWLLNSFKYHSYTGRSLLAYGVMMAFWVAVVLFHFMRMRLADEEDRTMQAELERQRDYQMPYLVEDEYTLNDRYTRLALSGESSSEMELAPEKRKRR